MFGGTAPIKTSDVVLRKSTADFIAGLLTLLPQPETKQGAKMILDARLALKAITPREYADACRLGRLGLLDA